MRCVVSEREIGGHVARRCTFLGVIAVEMQVQIIKIALCSEYGCNNGLLCFGWAICSSDISSTVLLNAC